MPLLANKRFTDSIINFKEDILDMFWIFAYNIATIRGWTLNFIAFILFSILLILFIWVFN